MNAAIENFKKAPIPEHFDIKQVKDDPKLVKILINKIKFIITWLSNIIIPYY